MTFAEAAAAIKIAKANLDAAPGDSAVWAAYCAADRDLRVARDAEAAVFAAAVAAERKPARRTSKASGGRVVHTVGNKSWTEY